jgi:hypothetical protein
MYKNGIPAEYLVRQALREGLNNSSHQQKLRDEYRGTWSQNRIGRGEKTPSATLLLGSFRKPQANAA